ncbi:MAG TPA: cadmium resistance transporter, partial [Cytophagales bacterium]|nr:cadmium resistance transporter [Cytophagales bacterium]
FLGLAALVLLSLCGMWLGSFWDHRYISFLGLVPIFLGVKGLYALYRHFNESDPEPTFNTTATLNFMNVATVTFANGGDNLGVYTPIFAHIDTDGIIVFVSVFVLMTAFWCMLGFYLVQHVAIRSIFEKYGKVILPCFMIIIGIWILLT